MIAYPPLMLFHEEGTDLRANIRLLATIRKRIEAHPKLTGKQSLLNRLEMMISLETSFLELIEDYQSYEETSEGGL